MPEYENALIRKENSIARRLAGIRYVPGTRQIRAKLSPCADSMDGISAYLIDLVESRLSHDDDRHAQVIVFLSTPVSLMQ